MKVVLFNINKPRAHPPFRPLGCVMAAALISASLLVVTLASYSSELRINTLPCRTYTPVNMQAAILVMYGSMCVCGGVQFFGPAP